MKFQSIFQILVYFSLLCLIASALAQNDEAKSPSSPMRRKFKLPELFNFDKFKQLFGKKYASFSEEMARRKIFLGRAFKAFLSSVAYKYKKKTSYTKIHENSDWTNEEMRATELTNDPFLSNEIEMVDLGGGGGGVKEQEQLSQTRSKEITPVADYGDVAKKLQEIEDNQNQPGYKEVANEIKTSNEDIILNDDDQEDFFDESAAVNVEPGVNAKLLSFINKIPGTKYLNFAMKSVIGKLFQAKGEQRRSRGESATEKLTLDHRSCLGDVKGQGKCGSCYIFSTTSLYEWHYCKEKGEKISFSEQYPLDCGDRIGMKGCAGGPESLTAQFYGRYGLILRGHYQYRKRSDICPYDKYVGPRKMAYITVNQEKLAGYKKEYWLKRINDIPILMGIGVSDQFHDYGGGVDIGEYCDTKRKHSVLIVGSGVEDGIEYWLMRNSYGKSWGEEGHFKMSKAATHCLLQDGAGFMLKHDESKPIFNEVNDAWDIEPVKRRHLDYKNKLTTMIRPTPTDATTEASIYSVTPKD